MLNASSAQRGRLAVLFLVLLAVPLTASEIDDAEELFASGDPVAACRKLQATVGTLQGQVAAKPEDAKAVVELLRATNKLAKYQTTLFQFPQARTLLKKAIADRPGAKDPAVRLELARCHALLGWCNREAELLVEGAACQREAIRQLEALVKEFPGQAAYQQELSAALMQHGIELMGLGRYPDSEAAFRDSLRVARQLAAANPRVPEHADRVVIVLNAYVLLVREWGRFAESATLLREGIALLERLRVEHPDKPKHWAKLPQLYRNLSHPLEYGKDNAGAEAARRTASRIEDEMSRLPAVNGQQVIATENKLLGSLLTRDQARLVGQKAEIDAFLKQAEQQAKDHPDVPVYQSRLAMAHLFLAARKLTDGTKDEVNQHFRTARAILAKLAQDHPDIPKYQLVMGETCLTAAFALLMQRETAEGEKMMQEGIAYQEKLAARSPGSPRFRWSICDSLFRAAIVHDGLGDRREATRRLTSVLTVLQRLVADYPVCPLYHRQLAQAQVNLGIRLAAVGQHTEAEAALREGVRLWEKCAAAFPTTLAFQMEWAEAYGSLATYLLGHDRLSAAEEASGEGIKILERLVTREPQEASYHKVLGASLGYQALMIEKLGRHPDALAARTRALGCLETALRLQPRRKDWLSLVQTVHRQRSETYRHLSRSAEAEKDEARAAEIEVRLGPPLLRLGAARECVKTGESGRAESLAEELFAEELPAYEWAELAETYGKLADAVREAESKERALRRAVEALGKHVAAGGDVAALAVEPRFQGLRGRADFQQLIAKPRR